MDYASWIMDHESYIMHHGLTTSHETGSKKYKIHLRRHQVCVVRVLKKACKSEDFLTRATRQQFFLPIAVRL